MGFLPGADLWMERAVEQLRYRRDQFVSGGASFRARRSGPPDRASIPLIHGGGPVGAAAAQRWKTQVNENAKRLAFYEHATGAVPQRDLRLGRKLEGRRRPDEPGDAAPRQRAPPGRPPLRDHRRPGPAVGGQT